jgi:hypothetical protein
MILRVQFVCGYVVPVSFPFRSSVRNPKLSSRREYDIEYHPSSLTHPNRNSTLSSRSQRLGYHVLYYKYVDILDGPIICARLDFVA